MALYMGVELNKDFCMVSVYEPAMEEPNTFSPGEGGTSYTIPYKMTVFKGGKKDFGINNEKSGEPVIITQAGRDGNNFGVLNLQFDQVLETYILLFLL